jgi:alkylhydroperoxidase family enzyme
VNAFIPPPPRIPWFIRIGIWFAERTTRKEMTVGRLLAWYPRAAISSGILEGLIAHKEPGVDERLLKLVRLQSSYAVACPFCIDMNSYAYAEYGISADEIAALRGKTALDDVGSFSERERIALEYARLVSQTPLKFPQSFIDRLNAHFTPREIVILSTTAAQVNYWARLIQALGVPPVGYSEKQTR